MNYNQSTTRMTGSQSDDCNMCTSNHVLARHVLVSIVLEVNKNVKDEINWRNINLTQ